VLHSNLRLLYGNVSRISEIPVLRRSRVNALALIANLLKTWRVYQCMKREELRTKTAGCKVTESEHAALEAAAARAGMTLSDWCRETLTAAADETAGTVAEQTVLAEVMALRTILLNLVFRIGHGETVAPDDMQEIINRPDGGKLEKARARLTAARNGPGKAEPVQ